MSFDPADWLRAHAFPAFARGAAAGIGAEVELLSLDAATWAPVHAQSRLMPFLCRWAGERGGAIRIGAKGGARVAMPDSAAFTIEPGGQLEFASAPSCAPSSLLRAIDDVLPALTRAAADEGIELLGKGIDPLNGPGAAPLQIPAERYCRMDAYFESIGPAGRRMMRQTAAVQVNVDPAGSPAAVWHALNAASPFLTALFANSRVYAGQDTGCTSFRAETWRQADPRRTGFVEEARDPADAYAAFAMDAPVMRPARDGRYRPFRTWLEAGLADELAWEDHLTTLFPEVRPKRYLEVRSMDAQPVDSLALPLLVCAGIALDPAATEHTRELLGAPDPGRLREAGRSGLADPRMAATCRQLVDIALEGCGRLGPERCSPGDIERAAELARARLATTTVTAGRHTAGD